MTTATTTSWEVALTLVVRDPEAWAAYVRDVGDEQAAVTLATLHDDAEEAGLERSVAHVHPLGKKIGEVHVEDLDEPTTPRVPVVEPHTLAGCGCTACRAMRHEHRTVGHPVPLRSCPTCTYSSGS